ncbi:hypothetical protein BEP19_13640 [Ammoniphilus oxalaticus]|uniref:Cytosolic protein n=1 Tax=Ammoniphilus oxalaticus TaxID=66863 RepID=A0A419SEA5_9BACL|nr:YqgQ family protein [Ammoniphilus oxalaticus]RKD21676.1 hypothetical protein BEP19_13640 [Ammoniphilus oxalaticus]
MERMSFLDVKDLLRTFGIFIYTGDAIADCELMEDELKELHQAGLIPDQDLYRFALLTIRKRISDIKQNRRFTR